MNFSLKRMLYVLALLLLLGVAVILLRTMMFNSPPEKVGSPLVVKDSLSYSIERFQGALCIPTVSNNVYDSTDFYSFERFGVYLSQVYPMLGKQLDSFRVNKYGLVYRWKGKDPSLKPYLFTAHYDVVPVQEATRHLWTHAPFGAEIADGKIYSRGTLDDKCSVISLLEAVKMHVDSGFVPKRDIYLAFGHDEECGGRNGALQIAQYFKSKEIEFEAVFDEGGVVTVKGTGGIDADLALVGIAEKGNANVSVKVKKAGGHSSMPASVTALGAASQIISDLESNQFEPRIIPPVKNMLSNVCHTMGFAAKMAVANSEIFEPVLLKVLTEKPSTNAMVRTTTAMTMISGSSAPNVLPQEVVFVGNFRVLPGESVEDVISHVKKAAEGFDAEVTLLQGNEPSAISPSNTRSIELLKANIEKYYPNALMTPYLTMASTDSRHYYIVSDNVYRFMPAQLTEKEQALMHGIDEYISIDNFKRMIFFYKDFMEMLD